MAVLLISWRGEPKVDELLVRFQTKLIEPLFEEILYRLHVVVRNPFDLLDPLRVSHVKIEVQVPKPSVHLLFHPAQRWYSRLPGGR